MTTNDIKNLKEEWALIYHKKKANGTEYWIYIQTKDIDEKSGISHNETHACSSYQDQGALMFFYFQRK